MKRGKPLQRRKPLRARPPERGPDRGAKPIARKARPKRSARKRWRPPPEALADYKVQRRRLWEAQGERCAGCGKQADLSRLELSHKRRLGTRASRYNRAHPLNSDENCEMLCRPCHQAHEAKERAEHADWMREATGAGQ